jgi:ATP-dependent exoDNAse (exonuclease V) beta subunit
MEYQEDVFRRAVEALNTFYVACTRPRHGLIIDINLEGNFEKQGSSFYRLPYQTGKLLLSQFGKTNFAFDENESKLEEGLDGLMLRFRVGEIVAMPDKKEEKDLILPSEKSRFASFPARLSARKAETTVLGQRVGVLVHKILEKIIHANEWPEKLQLEFRTGAWLDSELNSAAEELQSLFQNAEMMAWFSGDWNQYPEQELMSPEGKILRIDRILEKDGQFILLDFKTGEESESHWLQIREYLNMFKMASGVDASAWIVYSRKAKAYILT